jgi:acetyl esterase/lipase
MISAQSFHDDSIDPETRQFLTVLDALADVPTAVNTPLPVLREARANGSAALPMVKLDNAVDQEFAGPADDLPLRCFTPRDRCGGYLHFHGGGFVMGAPDQQDTTLDAIAHGAELEVVSAGYRLAPEHPFPAAVDDCLAVARWFIEAAWGGRFGGGPLFIGGESAGAHLAVTTLLRLRKLGLAKEFQGVVLNFGFFDLGLTPSARNWGDRYAIISTPILQEYVEAFVPRGDVRSPAVSPLYARLEGLPHALFSVGTRDPLLDDSLMMSQRWIAAGNTAEVEVYSGGIHAFPAFDLPISKRWLATQIDFLRRSAAR